MDRDELRGRLLATFLGELEEHVRDLNRNALALEKDAGDRRAELLKTLFRTAHSIKGAARSAGVGLMEATCHRLEEILSAVRDGAQPVNADLVQLLLAAADALEDAGRRLHARQDLGGSSLGFLLSRLETGETMGLGASPLPSPAPTDASTSRDGFVRLPATKLDALVAKSGELLIARGRAASRRNDVDGLIGMMNQCLVQWQRLEKPLRKLVSLRAGNNSNGAQLNGLPLPRRAAAAFGHTKEGLKKLERSLERLAHGLLADQRMLEQAAAPLEEEIRHVRMLPFGEACEGLDRVVRDLGKAAGKEVDLVIEGADVELDRAVLDALRDPLLHLVRNAVDYGIEPPTERTARGKPPGGRITVSAALRGSGVEVSVADDGRGLDVAAVRERAAMKGWAVPQDQRDLVHLIFLPGFSTAPLVTELSGRGVGLDVVKHCVETLHGSVDVAFEVECGTRFTLAVPLTLTTLRALLVRAGGQLLALPTSNVRSLIRVRATDLASMEGRDVLIAGGAPVPVASLAATLGLAPGAHDRNGDKVPLVMVASGERQAAFAVDELVAEAEVVVKSLGKRLLRVRHYAGATVLPTGRLALILAAGDLLQTALGHKPTSALAPTLEKAAETSRKRLLLVEDSVTTRSLEKSILEAAGYEVLAAPDGAEAWQILLERGADLVVADVEMPRMDGFQLTEAIRGSKRFRDLPVVLVTALETERDKTRGLEAGADAYILKSTFDQKQLLEVIAQLL